MERRLILELTSPEAYDFRLPNLGSSRSERLHTATRRHIPETLYEGLMAA
jgi:hypothetical protein